MPVHQPPLLVLRQLLASTFGLASYDVWFAVLRAALALPLTNEERTTLAEVTSRKVLPSAQVRELWLLLGRRSGKSLIAALMAVLATTCRTYTLAAGEVGTFMIIAADRKQARVIKRYISGLLNAHPALAALIANETADSIELTNGLTVEIHTCSFRSLRGYTVIGAALDEVAFWDSEDSANPDREVLIALRAAMASQPQAMLIALTSVYARRGEVWRTFEQHYGKDSSDRVLVVNGPTTRFNPTINDAIIAQAYEDDPVAAAAEYGAEFRRDVESFLPVDAVDAVRVRGRMELPWRSGVMFKAFIDPAGGTGADSMTLAIAHIEDGRGVLDAVREVQPPFSPDSVVTEFASLLKTYHLDHAQADRYAGDWPTEAFRKHGIRVDPSPLSRSEIYLAALPSITSGRIELLDHPRLLRQLTSLERRRGRHGRDSVDAPPRQHEDVANAACGALVAALDARTISMKDSILLLQLGDVAPSTRPSPCGTDADAEFPACF